MGKLKLYGVSASPPVRACLLTLNAMELPFEFQPVNLFALEHLSSEYLEKNPQHTVPMLEDEGDVIWDSHAIMAYLVRKYGKSDELYPKDYLQRAIVDQRLHFESSVVFQGCLRNITAPLFFKNETNVPQSKIDAIVEMYEFLEAFLEGKPYMAGDKLTIADFSIIASLSSVVAFIDIDADKFPKLLAWIKRLEQLPYYREANKKGALELIAVIKSKNFQIVE